MGKRTGGLGIDEAAVLPQQPGDGRVPQPFTITERITLHVRHRAKYFEVLLPEEQAFVFTCNGQASSTPKQLLAQRFFEKTGSRSSVNGGN